MGYMRILHKTVTPMKEYRMHAYTVKIQYSKRDKVTKPKPANTQNVIPPKYLNTNVNNNNRICSSYYDYSYVMCTCNCNTSRLWLSVLFDLSLFFSVHTVHIQYMYFVVYWKLEYHISYFRDAGVCPSLSTLCIACTCRSYVRSSRRLHDMWERSCGKNAKETVT